MKVTVHVFLSLTHRVVKPQANSLVTKYQAESNNNNFQVSCRLKKIELKS